jgi:hypothetical protein
MKILRTKDYDKFVLVHGNREIKHAKKMKKAMDAIGNLTECFPIVCCKEGSKLKILEGQGRFEACRQRGDWLSYVVTDKITEDMIGSINDVPTKWSTKNHVSYYADRGHKAYVELRKFINETGIPVTVALQLCSGSISDGGVTTIKFKHGELEVKDMDHAYKVANVISVLKKHGIQFATNRSLVLALNRICKTKSFDLSRLDKKMEYQTGRFTKCAEYTQYIQMIDDIYNYRATSGNIVSLVMEVKQNGDWTK